MAKRGQDRAQKVAGRTATEGTVECYLHHNGKVGVLIELNCNTDFVARNEDFRQLARDLAMHIAALSPVVVNREDLDAELVSSLRTHYASEVPKGKPQQIVDKIVDGKMQSWFAERVLLDQPFAKDDSKTVRQLIEEKIAKTKENIQVARFVRYQVGATAAAAATGE
ncbi:MAG: elongation factor Ts [Planctomycetota bacterium]